MTFDEILNTIEDSLDKETAKQLFTKNPQLHQAALRQNDYSKKLDDLRAKESQFNEIATFAQSWADWREKNWDEDNNSTKQETALKQRIAELESKENDVTFADIEKFVVDKGLLDKTSFNKSLEDKSKQFEQELKGGAYVQAKLVEMASSHLHEFNKPFKATEFLTKFHEYGVTDLDRAYDLHVNEMREAKKTKELEDRIKKAEAEAFNKGKTEALQTQFNRNGSNLPTNDGEDMSYLQKRSLGLEHDNLGGKDYKGPLAGLIAQKYHEDKLNSAGA